MIYLERALTVFDAYKEEDPCWHGTCLYVDLKTAQDVSRDQYLSEGSQGVMVTWDYVGGGVYELTDNGEATRIIVARRDVLRVIQ